MSIGVLAMSDAKAVVIDGRYLESIFPDLWEIRAQL